MIKRVVHRFYCKLQTNYVPKHYPVQERDVRNLSEFINSSKRLVILTGAGVSTESGIPDYRSEEVGLYARTNHKPIQYQAFIKDADVRNRYWARNYVGWSRFSQCQPNGTHLIINKLANVSGVITQNVDSLHTKAGSANVIELHGSAYKVVCLDCEMSYSRHELQDLMKELNPKVFEVAGMIRPDGDVEISEEAAKKFKAPECTSCGGILKPDIVFFGDNVPKLRVESVRRLVTDCDAVLALGTSLTVFSSYRIILQALEAGKLVAIVNIGPTRADDMAHLKINAKCGDILPKVINVHTS